MSARTAHRTKAWMSQSCVPVWPKSGDGGVEGQKVIRAGAALCPATLIIMGNAKTKDRKGTELRTFDILP